MFNLGVGTLLFCMQYVRLGILRGFLNAVGAAQPYLQKYIFGYRDVVGVNNATKFDMQPRFLV